jgi:hypothetical protein
VFYISDLTPDGFGLMKLEKDFEAKGSEQSSRKLRGRVFGSNQFGSPLSERRFFPAWRYEPHTNKDKWEWFHGPDKPVHGARHGTWHAAYDNVLWDDVFRLTESLSSHKLRAEDFVAIRNEIEVTDPSRSVTLMKSAVEGDGLSDRFYDESHSAFSLVCRLEKQAHCKKPHCMAELCGYISELCGSQDPRVYL